MSLSPSSCSISLLAYSFYQWMHAEDFPFIVHNGPESLLHAYAMLVEINPALPLLLKPVFVNWGHRSKVFGLLLTSSFSVWVVLHVCMIKRDLLMLMNALVDLLLKDTQ